MDHEQKSVETAAESAERMDRRDGELYIALGFFIGIVGLPVLFGTYFAAQEPGRMHAAIVNAVCGIALLLIAAASALYGVFILKRQKNRQA